MACLLRLTCRGRNISYFSPDLISADWTAYSPFNLRSDWTPASWFETPPSVSGVYVGAFSLPSPPVNPSLITICILYHYLVPEYSYYS